jgi:hypothetical protein
VPQIHLAPLRGTLWFWGSINVPQKAAPSERGTFLQRENGAPVEPRARARRGGRSRVRGRGEVAGHGAPGRPVKWSPSYQR